MAEAFFDPAAYDSLKSQEAGHFWHETRRDLIQWMAHRWFPDARAICEVGCGTGFVMQRLREVWKDALVLGAEFYEKAIPIASRRNPGAVMLRASALQLPFSGTLDVLCAFDVIEHIEDDGTALQQFHAALKPGGGLLLTVPQHMILWSYHDEFQHHKRRYSRTDLLGKLVSAGFTIAYVNSFASILFPLMLLSRRISRAKTEVDANLPPSFLTNAVLRAIMRVEVGLTKRGLRWPFGGSLFVVAVKADGHGP